MNPIWFLRMARWLRHPPSKRQILIWVVVGALCCAVAGIEWLWGWPDWLTVNGRPRLSKP
jgi:hypothetical protein